MEAGAEEVARALLLGLRALGAEELEVRGEGFRLVLRRARERQAPGGSLIVSPVSGRVSYSQAGIAAEPGGRVRKGQTVAVVESMKVAVEVISEVEGRVVKVLVPEGARAEAGEPLLEVEVEEEA